MPPGQKGFQSLPESRKEEITRLFKPPEGELTADEFLRRCHGVPEITRIMVEKYVAGAWSVMEDGDTIGPGFNPEELTAYLDRKHGQGRYRLRARGNGGLMIGVFPCVYVGEWKEAEDAQRFGVPRTGVGVVSAAPSMSRDLKAVLAERVETDGAVATLERLESSKRKSELEPMQMLMQTMASTMQMVTTTMTSLLEIRNRGSAPDPMVTLLLEQATADRKMLMEVLLRQNQPGSLGPAGAVKEVLALVETVREQFGGGDHEPKGTDWAKVAEVAAPILRDTIRAMPRSGPAPAGSASIGPALIEPEPELHDAHAAGDGGREAMMQNPKFLKLIGLALDTLKSRSYRDFHAIVSNVRTPSGEPFIEFDPEVNPAVYVGLLGVIDPGFDALGEEIAGYLDWLKHAMSQDAGDGTV